MASNQSPPIFCVGCPTNYTMFLPMHPSPCGSFVLLCLWTWQFLLFRPALIWEWLHKHLHMVPKPCIALFPHTQTRDITDTTYLSPTQPEGKYTTQACCSNSFVHLSYTSTWLLKSPYSVHTVLAHPWRPAPFCYEQLWAAHKRQAPFTTINIL